MSMRCAVLIIAIAADGPLPGSDGESRSSTAGCSS